ncbi:CocE/NonD family hydrolase [Catenibacillus scindens]|uniref:CocE/NonD family hydrolase n=1 Tax=Catenibacillus scindens TaxID=673271 RepID=UPI0032083F74
MRGIFLDGCVTGLDYRTQTYSGQLDARGYFEYEDGESVLFSIGGFVIGSCPAKEWITPLDFVAESVGRHLTVSHYQVVNIARFLISLGKVDESVRAAVNTVRYDIQFVQETESFEKDPVITGLFEGLGKTLVSAAAAKNIVRRCANGIRKERDVKIPVADGGYVLADVYRPLKDGKYPVVMCMGVFGKEFINGFVENEAEEVYRQEVEDRFYDDYANVETKHMLQEVFFGRMGPCFGSAMPVPNTDPEEKADAPAGPPPCLVPVSEAFEQPCAMDWVPYGYVVINIEERGTGKNTNVDLFRQFGASNAKDYCDAIEWAANQPWSTGKIGLFGASYYAMTQYLAAQRKPEGLTAMIPIMGDYDSYRDYIYSGGGLFNRADNMDPCREPQPYNFMKKAMDEPFWNEETYGPEGEYMSSCDISAIDLPIFPCVEPDASLHAKGSSEAYINSPSKNKKLMILNGCGIHFWMYQPQYLNKFRAFFDYWLKGTDNGIMDEPAVDLQMRTGEGSYYWRHESDWPVPGTKYVRFYLNAAGNAAGLSQTTPENESSVTYNGDVYHKVSGRVPGATFISAPLEEDMELAGYIKAGLFVASTTTDMEIHMKIRVLDENDREVIYPARTSMERGLPLGFGALKVSHRQQDEKRTRYELPVYKHTKEAWAPLTPGEVVYCEIGSFPTTGVIRKGWKIRLDIDPAGSRWVDYNEAGYRRGALNTIYTGGERASFVQLPVLPSEK